MKGWIWLWLTVPLLSACASGQAVTIVDAGATPTRAGTATIDYLSRRSTQRVATIIAIKTESWSYTSTPVPTITQIAIPTSLPTATLSPLQYPRLSKAALANKDFLGIKDWNEFKEYFFGPSSDPPAQRNRPGLTDITQSLAGHCFQDCSGTLLSLPGRSVAIYMFRYQSPDDARSASEELCLGIYNKEFNQKLDGIKDCIGNYLDAGSAPTLDTWVAPYFGQDVLGATYGSIFIKVVLYFPGRWDEYFTKPNILAEVATLQIQKLKQIGFSATP